MVFGVRDILWAREVPRARDFACVEGPFLWRKVEARRVRDLGLHPRVVAMGRESGRQCVDILLSLCSGGGLRWLPGATVGSGVGDVPPAPATRLASATPPWAGGPSCPGTPVASWFGTDPRGEERPPLSLLVWELGVPKLWFRILASLYRLLNRSGTTATEIYREKG